MDGNFKFQVQDSILEYFFWEIWRFEKRITLAEKKPPLIGPLADGQFEIPTFNLINR